MIALTFFPSLRDAQGKRVRTTWEKLIGRLTVASVVANKDDSKGVSLATFRDDRRSLANVDQVYAVGLDLDKQVDWGALITRFDATDSFLHTTWSSTDAEPRARVFLRLSRPCSGDEYRRVYQACAGRAEEGGLVVDRKASDPSRFWFLPSIPPGGSYRYSVGKGRPVNVDGALRLVPAPAPPQAPPRLASTATSADVEARAAAYLERCDPAISGSGGDAHTFFVAQILTRGFALDEETSFHLICRWNATCSPPWDERSLRRKIREAATRGTMPLGSRVDRPAMRRAS